MRAYALAGAALATFFAGVALQVSAAAFAGVDLVSASLFTAGSAGGVWTYVRETTAPARRIAVVATGLNLAGLVMLAAASL